MSDITELPSFINGVQTLDYVLSDIELNNQQEPETNKHEERERSLCMLSNWQ